MAGVSLCAALSSLKFGRPMDGSLKSFSDASSTESVLASISLASSSASSYRLVSAV